jgi:hypothetical protein
VDRHCLVEQRKRFAKQGRMLRALTKMRGVAKVGGVETLNRPLDARRAASCQDGQNETEQTDHSASLGDSITASTRIRFSVHAGFAKAA